MGQKTAETAFYKIADEHDEIVKTIMRMRAETFDGVLAKIRTGAWMLPKGDDILDRINEEMHLFGVDESVVSGSIVRDLAKLAGVGERE